MYILDGPDMQDGLSHKQKYMFDLNGFLILRGALSLDEIEAANEAVDAHEEGELHERTGKLRCSSLYGRKSTELEGDGSTGRMDMGGMLGWPKPQCSPFRNLLCHPSVVPALTELLGVGEVLVL
jgi:hypothetical protein